MAPLPRNNNNPSNEDEDYCTLKMSLNGSLRDNKYRPLVLNSVNNLVMFASCIAVRGSLLHNYIITKCVNDDKEVTKEMFDMRYMYQIYSGLDLPPDDVVPRDQLVEGQDIVETIHMSNQMKSLIQKLNKYPELRDALVALQRNDEVNSLKRLPIFDDFSMFMTPLNDDDLPPTIPDGQSCIINYIIRDQIKNIKNQSLPKGKAIINDAVNAHIRIKYLETDTSRRVKTSLRQELLRSITTPTKCKRQSAPELELTDTEFVNSVRKGFLPPDHFTAHKRANQWLDDDYFTKAKHLPFIITQFVKLLRLKEYNELFTEISLRGRPPLPLFHSGRRISISLDAIIMYYVISNAKKLESMNGRCAFSSRDPNWVTAVNKFKSNRPLVTQWIHRVFDFDRWKENRPGCGKWRISDDKGIFATTNGVVINVLLRSGRITPAAAAAVEEEAERALLLSNSRLQLYNDDNEDNDSDWIQSQETDPTSLGEDDMDIEDLDVDYPEDDDHQGDHHPRRSARLGSKPSTANLDPGRRNIIYCLILDEDGKFLKRVVLTRAEYYEVGMINYIRERSHHWNQNPELIEMNEDFSECNFITADNEKLMLAFETYVQYHTRLWTLRGWNKKWARQKFLLYGKKKSIIQKKLNEFDKVTVEDQKYHLIKVNYEDGEFASGKKFERYVPCQFIRTACQSQYPTEMIPKHRTSQVCPDCHARLQDVYLQDEIDVRSNHAMGLKYCNNTDCSNPGNRLKIRDELACYNIHEVAQPNPHSIFERATQGSEHYWGSDPSRHILRRYGMASSRPNGMAATGHFTPNEQERENRSLQKQRNKAARYQENKILRRNIASHNFLVGQQQQQMHEITPGAAGAGKSKSKNNKNKKKRKNKK